MLSLCFLDEKSVNFFLPPDLRLLFTFGDISGPALITLPSLTFYISAFVLMPLVEKSSREIQSVCPANGLQGSLACGLTDCIFLSFHSLNAPKQIAGTAGH